MSLPLAASVARDNPR